MLGHHFVILLDHKLLSYLFASDKQTLPMAWAHFRDGHYYWVPTTTVSANDQAKLTPPQTHSAIFPFRQHQQTYSWQETLYFCLNDCKSYHSGFLTYASWLTVIPLAKVRTFVLQEWPIHLEGEEFQPFVCHKDELSVSDHVFLWGSRVIVPPKARERVIGELHSTHPGVSHMKSLAQSYVWWLSMDTGIENLVKSCHTCQKNLNSPPKAPLHPWEWPELSWSHCTLIMLDH